MGEILHVLQLMWVYFTCPDNGQLYLWIVFSAITYRDFSFWGRSNINKSSELLELQLVFCFWRIKPIHCAVLPMESDLKLMVKIFPGALGLCARAPLAKSGWLAEKAKTFLYSCGLRFLIFFYNQVKMQIFLWKFQSTACVKSSLTTENTAQSSSTCSESWASLIQKLPCLPWVGQGLRGLGAKQQKAIRNVAHVQIGKKGNMNVAVNFAMSK